MPDSQWYPSKLYLINNVEDIVVFLGLSDNICFPARVTFVEKSQFKIVFKIIIIDICDQTKLLRVPRLAIFAHGSLEITLNFANVNNV